MVEFHETLIILGTTALLEIVKLRATNGRFFHLIFQQITKVKYYLVVNHLIIMGKEFYLANQLISKVKVYNLKIYQTTNASEVFEEIKYLER